jgi:iron(III) transport system substrate-binding protein
MKLSQLSALIGCCLLLAACGGAPASAPRSGGSQSGGSAAGLGGAQAAWDALVTAAKKEGKITVSVGAGGGPQFRQTIPPAFKEEFGIDMEVIVGPSTEMVNRLRLEQSSGLHTVDVAIGGSDTMYLNFYGEKLIQPMRPMLIHPDVLNGDNWVDGKPWFMDPDEQYILRLSNGITGQTVVNTTMVTPNDLTTPEDMLKPQYKGKLAGFDPTINGSGAQHAVFLQIKLGTDFIKKLYVDQQMARTTDNRQLGDWIGRGNYAIAVVMNTATLEQAKKDGLPVKEVPPFKETGQYITAGSGLMAVLKDDPHPNAAALLANWMALPKAQTLYNRAQQYSSVLKTVHSDWVPSYADPKPGVNYFDLYDWNYTLNEYPKAFEIVRKTLGT